MGATLNERNPNVDIIPLGTTTSSASLVVPGLYMRKHARIKNVYLADQAGISKSNTNHVLVTLQDLSANPYASIDTSAAAAVANTPLAMPLSSQDDDSAQSVSQEKDVPAGTMLNVAIAGTGSGVVTKANVIVEWYPL